MLKQVFHGYGKLLKIFLAILLAVAGCAAVSYLFIWPLWFVATSFPSFYTFLILTLICIFCIFVITKKIIKFSKLNISKNEKKIRTKKLLLTLFKILPLHPCRLRELQAYNLGDE